MEVTFNFGEHNFLHGGEGILLPPMWLGFDSQTLV